MLRVTSLTLMIAVLNLAPLAAQTVPFGGEAGDTGAPVEISADNFRVSQSAGSAEFSGNVLIAQGEMKLSAEKVVVDYAEGDNSRIESLEASGNVTLVNGEDAAESQRAVYEVGSGNITLIGDVLLSQGQNVMSGDEVVVNLEDGTAQASGRVRSVLQPSGN
ncbi:lipopolysaccharide transport periplasmic protein LptA [Paracoccus sediminicola]|uniref:lipopolysaccharide transport periplasmic protein LptA n=1 Tax=Paracoccus sediminicola TaxID=3017783 RepID=UPI0022EFFE1D|nr:lipopolysaccharide transport periplasmic protein LptA [Paracoccus sediminicola]WBU56449.1 lipopolysaccharide transport periplasmic protein LptA [Paracoccus sediminicola]